MTDAERDRVIIRTLRIGCFGLCALAVFYLGWLVGGGVMQVHQNGRIDGLEHRLDKLESHAERP